MEKDKGKKALSPKALSVALIVAVLALGTFLMWKISDNFFGALSEKEKMVEVKPVMSGSEDVDFEELVNGVMGETGKTENMENDESGFQSVSDPAEAYLVMRRELSEVDGLEGLVALTEKYGSEKNISYIKQVKAVGMFIGEEEIMSAVAASASEKIKSAETVSSSVTKATLKVVTESGKEGEVVMVFERGSWRFDSEKW